MPRLTTVLVTACFVAAASAVGAAPASARPAPETAAVQVVAPPAPVPQPRPEFGTPEHARWYAARQLASFGWPASEMECLTPMWIGESHWDYREVTGKYIGIPQTTPGVVRQYGESMDDYVGDPEVQVDVGLRYIEDRYGSPCAAWEFWKAQGAWQDDSDPSQWWGGWY